LFEGEVKTVDLSIKGSSVNCGVDPIEGSVITKGLRKLDGGQMEGKIDVPFRDAKLRVINIQEMANKLKQELRATGDFTSAQFAATMIEGSPKIRFCSRSV
jgi:hypothetical protein